MLEDLAQVEEEEAKGGQLGGTGTLIGRGRGGQDGAEGLGITGMTHCDGERGWMEWHSDAGYWTTCLSEVVKSLQNPAKRRPQAPRHARRPQART